MLLASGLFWTENGSNFGERSGANYGSPAKK